MGWNVVNVDYRVARIAQSPAAVEDCLCALRWVAANAKQHHIDVNWLVVTGDSSGGHLALTTGMIPESAGLDRQCPGVPLPKVAAIVDYERERFARRAEPANLCGAMAGLGFESRGDLQACVAD
jgi:acetyl esterase/lipase